MLGSTLESNGVATKSHEQDLEDLVQPNWLAWLNQLAAKVRVSFGVMVWLEGGQAEAGALLGLVAMYPQPPPPPHFAPPGPLPICPSHTLPPIRPSGHCEQTALRGGG